MLRILLLLVGLSLAFAQHYLTALTTEMQFMVFLVGVLVLGVPHGAADLLVANQNKILAKHQFSTFGFLFNYITRLVLFAAILWFFPVFGNVLFIFFAAYHFGETDLHHLRTETMAGKMLVVGYGSLILSIILLPHFEEVKQIFLLFPSGVANIGLIEWIGAVANNIIVIVASIFFITFLNYYHKNRDIPMLQVMIILSQLLVLLFVLYNVPMLLGFSFYFIFWHSILSLTNIVGYLRKNEQNTYQNIIKQVVFYSALALGGIFIFGTMGFMLINDRAITAYLFLGLAVLTAPHMEVMHDMYKHIRKKDFSI
jgi:beta-carotene 15,15'-dioxygenase